MNKDETVILAMVKEDNTLKKRQLINLFWGGFIVYMIGYALMIMPNANYMFSDLLKISGVVSFLLATTMLMTYKFENRYLSLLFPIYMFWMLFTVLRGVEVNHAVIKNMLLNPLNGMFLYLIPFILLMPRNLRVFKLIFNVITLLGIVVILYVVYYNGPLLDPNDAQGRDILEAVIKLLALPSGFILFTFNYHSTSRKLTALFTILFCFALAAYRARRGLMLLLALILLFAIFIFFYVNKRKTGVVVGTFLGLVTIVSLGVVGVLNSNSEVVSRIEDRLDEDTRDGVEVYFYNDMQPIDWVIGRGINGLVKAPEGIDESGNTTGYRDGIETDYLNIILKGGVISLGLLLLIAFPAMIRGIFFSKNSFSKAAGLWVLLWMIMLYPSTVTTFSLNYMLVWLSIGICYSPKITNLSEASLKQYFKGGLDEFIKPPKTKLNNQRM